LKFEGTNASIENGWNLLASDDEWFAPVYADVGPDGGVYVSDFYSFIIQHNPTPSVSRGGFDAKTGKGNAFMSDLRDTEHARLWKVFPKDGKPCQQFKLSKDRPEELLAALTSDNQLWRKHAYRLLVERGNKDVAPKLKEILADPKVDEIGINGGAYAALWTLSQLGGADAATVTKALSHPATGVQRAALSLLPRDASGLAALQASGLLASKEALVRLTAMLALGEMPATADVGAKLYALTTKEAKDRWLPTALTVAAAGHAEGFLQEALKADLPDAAQVAAADPVNLLANPGFEELDGANPKGWKPSTYGGKASFTLDSKVSHSGKNSLRIDSSEGADVGWYIELPIEANSAYVLTGWIKTEKIETLGKGHGVMLELQKLGDKQPATAPLKGTADWTQVTLPFSSGAQKSLGINLLYGGWGFATGTAWWDDVKLIKIGSSNQSDTQILQVANAFIRTNPAAAKAALTPMLVTAKDLNDLKKTHTIVKVAIVAGQMKYDKAEYTATSGKPIAIVLYNPDVLQHNIVAGKPGSIDKIGNAATLMVTQPDGLAKNFIPAIPEILGGTAFANPNELLVLKLPKLEKGEYPLVCTFPGHWLIMRAMLKVE
jgi:azurin